MQDISPQDVNQAADSSDAAPVTTEATAPAGVTAAPSQDGGAQGVQAKSGLEFQTIPYQRFQSVNERARKFEQELARERTEKAEIAKKVADYEARLAKANEEPPAWWLKAHAPKQEEPTFDDPLEAKAYQLQKALDERTNEIAELRKGLDEHRTSFTTYQQNLESQAQQAKFAAQIDADIDTLTKSEPALAPHLPDILQLVIESNGAISVQRAALIWRHENLAPSASVRPAVTAPTAPPMASATATAPRKPGPGPVTSTPGNLQPARPKATSVSDITERLMARAEAGTLFAKG